MYNKHIRDKLQNVFLSIFSHLIHLTPKKNYHAKVYIEEVKCKKGRQMTMDDE